MLKNLYRNFLLFLISPCRISLAWIPWTLCIGMFLLNIFRYYPGRVDPDTYNQYCQMEVGIIGDWHPPIMVATWQLCRWAYCGLTGETIRGEGFLYVAWTFLMAGGLLLILRSHQPFWQNKGEHQKSWWGVGVVVCFLLWLFFEFVGEPLHIIRKDVGLLASYLFAVGCLMSLPSKGFARWCVASVALFFFFYGTAIRHNAIFAVIPLLCWLVCRMIPQRKTAVIVFYTFILWIAMLATIHVVNYDVIGAVRLYPLQERFYADIFHLNARSNCFVLPPNTFGNDFSDLDEKVFREKFKDGRLNIRGAFHELNEFYPGKNFTLDRSVDIIVPSPSEDAVRSVPEFYGDHRDIDYGCNYLMGFVSEELVRKQFPVDYPLLRKAWVNRVLQDPVTYVKFKTDFFLKYCRGYCLYFLGLNALLLLPLVSLIAVSFLLTKDPFQQPTAPGALLAWSALFYLAPLWMFLPEEYAYRYLYWFFAAGIISIASACANSELIRSLIGSIENHWDTKLRDAARSLQSPLEHNE